MHAKSEKLDSRFTHSLFRLFLPGGSSGQEYGQAQRALDQRGRLERLELGARGAFSGDYAQYRAVRKKGGYL